MSKSMDALEADVQDLVKGAEELNSKVASIKAVNESGTKTTASGHASATQVSDEMKTMLEVLQDFKASLDAEVEKFGNKESTVADLNAKKDEIKELYISFNRSARKCYDMGLAINTEEDEKEDDEVEIAELEEKIAEKIEEMEKEALEYQEKEEEFEAQKLAIEEELAKKKQLLEAELANPQQNYLYEGGDQSRSFASVL